MAQTIHFLRQAPRLIPGVLANQIEKRLIKLCGRTRGQDVTIQVLIPNA